MEEIDAHDKLRLDPQGRPVPGSQTDLEATEPSVDFKDKDAELFDGVQQQEAAGDFPSDEVILFKPSSLTAILLGTVGMSFNSDCSADDEKDDTITHVRIDKQLKVCLRDTSTALLVFYNDEDTGNVTEYILDLMTNVRKKREEFSPDRKLCAVTYQYRRLAQQEEFEIFPSQDGVEGLQNVQALDFALGQFTMMEDQSKARRASQRDLNSEDRGMQVEYDSNPGTSSDDQEQQYRANVVARGLEGSGSLVRTALRSGGRATGEAIRFLGKQYTSLLAPVADADVVAEAGDGDDENTADAIAGADRENTAGVGIDEAREPVEAVACEENEGEKSSLEQDLAAAVQSARQINGAATSTADAAVDADTDAVSVSSTTSSENNKRSKIDPKVLARAQSRKRWAEGVHSGARTVTGTALYPVRWTGSKASQWGKGGSDVPTAAPEDQSFLVRALSETLGGVGNGVMSICKGVTEAISEVGGAVGDCAMHHATVVHGEEYAQLVTKCYVDAASELGLAGYRVANLVALGWQGIILEAVIEGTVLAVALYDYLVGPVLLMGYMEMIQLPQSQLRRFFVVLRPWSLSFYNSSEDFTKKPFKIVPTALLDTMPKLRIRSQTINNGSGEKATSSSSNNSKNLSEITNKAPGGNNVEQTGKSATAAVSLPEAAAADEVAGDDESEYWYRSDYDAFDTSVSPVVKKFEPRLDREKKPRLLFSRRYSDSLDGTSELGMETVTRAEDAAVAAAASSDAVEELPEQNAIADSDAEVTAAESTVVRTDASSNRWFSVLSKWYGGNTDHIELNTIDCSSYLLYPALPATVLSTDSQRQQYEKLEHHTQLWFTELKEASKRVETIAKRRSGAEEIALFRRMNMYPHSGVLLITVKRFVHTMKPRSIFGNRDHDGTVDTSNVFEDTPINSPTGQPAATNKQSGDSSNSNKNGGGWFGFFNLVTGVRGSQDDEQKAQTDSSSLDVPPPQIIRHDSYSESVAMAVQSTEQFSDDGGDIMEGDQEISAAMAASLLDDETFFDYEDFIFVDEDEYVEGSHADADNDHLKMYSIYNESTYVNELQKYNRQLQEPSDPVLLDDEEPAAAGTPCSLTPKSIAAAEEMDSPSPMKAGTMSNPSAAATTEAASAQESSNENSFATPPRNMKKSAAKVEEAEATMVSPETADTPASVGNAVAFACFPARDGKKRLSRSGSNTAGGAGKFRSMFTAKVSTSFVPITERGIEITPEQFTTPAADLLRMPDYLCNVSSQLNALIAQERAEIEHSTASASTAAATGSELPLADAHLVAQVVSGSSQPRLMACKTLQDNLSLYSQVSQKKLVADWESDRIFKNLAVDEAKLPPDTIEMGKHINILADSGDCKKIRVKLRCKSNLPHFRVVGEGDIHLQDVPLVNSAADAARAAAAGSSLGDIWIPIVKSRKGDVHQVGALLVNVLKTSSLLPPASSC